MIKLLLVHLLLLTLCSCVTFEKQTLSYRYDKETDSLRIFQNYEGIYGYPQLGSKRVKISEYVLKDADKSNLKSVVEGERTFFFTNWLGEYNREWTTDKGLFDSIPKGSKELLAQALKLRHLIKHNIRIMNGEFYFNDDEMLSGYQMVTVSNVQKITELANKFTNNLMLNEVKHKEKSELKEEFSSGQNALLIKAAENHHTWIDISADIIKLSVPMSEKEFRELFKKDEFQYDKESGKITPKNAILKQLSFSYQNNLLIIEKQSEKDQITVITENPLKSNYAANAVDYVINKWGVLDQLNLNKVVVEFLLQIPIPQKAANLSKGKPIKRIIFEGNHTIPTYTIKSALKSKEGEPLNNETLIEDLRRIFKLGYFSDAKRVLKEEDDGYIITFTLQERKLIINIEFEGNIGIPKEELLKAIRSKVGDYYIPHYTDKVDPERIQKLYEESKRVAVWVSSEVIDKEDTVVIKYIIK